MRNKTIFTIVLTLISLSFLTGCATMEEEKQLPAYTPERFASVVTSRTAAVKEVEPPTVVINEVSLWNHSEYEALDGEFPHWLELKNYSDVPQQLEGWKLILHDQDGTELKFPAFPAVELKPGGIRMIVFVPKLSSLPVRGAIRFGADLPDTTASIELVDGTGVQVDLFTILPGKPYDWYAPIERDYSQLRDARLLSEVRIGTVATPGIENDSVISGPGFTADSGFYPEMVNLEFDTERLPEGYQIRYTINDGLVWDDDIYYGKRDWDYPTMASGIEYTGPVTLTETSVVKARVYSPTGACGPMEMKSFFVGEETSLPIVSLTTDPADLWDDVEGIYTAGTDPDAPNYAEKAFRQVHFEYFGTNTAASPLIDEDYIFRIYGLSSRGYPQKSMAFYAKEPGTTDRIPNEFFHTGSAKDIESFYSIVLRNSGGDNPRTMFRDAMATDLATGYDLEKQDYSPMILFINGQYWGIYNIREKINEYFIEDNTGVDPKGIDLIEGSYRDSMEVKEGSFDALDELLNLTRTVDPKFAVTYRMYEELVDIDNFIDYVIFQVFINNGDWPWSNTKMWRPRTEDGKWRFIMFDTDESMDTEEYNTQFFPDEGYPKGRPDFDMISYVYSEENSSIVSKLFRQLMRNEEFHERFISRFAYLLDTHLTAEMLQGKVDNHVSLIRAEMPRHTERWTFTDEVTGESSYKTMEIWEHEVQVVRDFSDQRGGYITQYLSDFSERVQPYEQVLLANGDFEDEDLSMWNMVWSEDMVHSEVIEVDGSRVGYLKVLEGGENPWDAVAYVYDDIMVEGEEQLRLSFDMKVGNKLKGDELVRVILLESDSYETIAVKDFSPTQKWDTFRMTFTYEHPTIFTGRLQFRIGNLGTGQEVFLDNITLEEVE